MRGRATGQELDSLDFLMRRREGNPDMPQLTGPGIRLGMEMVAATYALELSDFLASGWEDVRIEVDQFLTDPLDAGGEKSDAQLRQARDILFRQGAFSQVAGTLRQVKEADTCKAVIMAHPWEGGTVVAISFMGTTRRVFDWVSNLRMQQKKGVHQGFLELVQEFVEHEKDITFPSSGRRMGQERLSLADLVASSDREHVHFFLTGHSQGAAVAQLYMAYLLSRGVSPRQITGYGFASPSVLGTGPVDGCPMYHIMNADDVVPHMGALFHLGEILVYRPDAAFRRACYVWDWSEQACADRLRVRRVTGRMRDTRCDLLVGMAYLFLLREEPTEILLEGLRQMGHPVPRIPGQVAGSLDSSLVRGIERVIDHAGDAYESLFNEPVNPDHVTEIMTEIRALEEEMGVRRFVSAYGALCMEPHRARIRPDRPQPAYLCLVRNHLHELRRVSEEGFSGWKLGTADDGRAGYE